MIGNECIWGSGTDVIRKFTVSEGTTWREFLSEEGSLLDEMYENPEGHSRGFIAFEGNPVVFIVSNSTTASSLGCKILDAENFGVNGDTVIKEGNYHMGSLENG